MTTADWALIISICSAAVSAAGFIWNVWSKFIYPKPRVDVSFSFMSSIGGDPGRQFNVLTLNATNMGPAPVTLYSAMSMKKKLFRKPLFALLNPLSDFPADRATSQGPFSGGLPKRIDVGEQFTSYLIPDHEGLASSGITHVGFNDTFGRNHWCRKAHVARALPEIRAACDAAGKT